MVEIIIVLVVATACVIAGTFLIGAIAPKTGYGGPDIGTAEASFKRDLQRTAIRWLSSLSASIVGAYKLFDLIDMVLATIR